MFNTAAAAGKKKAIPAATRKPVSKVNEQESKDIMNDIFNDLDKNEDLQEHHH